MKLKKFFSITIICALLISFFAGVVYAEENNLTTSQEVNYDDDIMLINSNDETNQVAMDNMKNIRDDVYLLDSDVTLKDNVDGNVYIMAKDVEITSEEISGNVFICAEEINIRNTYINGSLFLVGEKINVTAFASDAYIAGNKVTLGEETRILRDLRVAADKLEINGVISRNVFASADDIKMNNNTIVEGNFNYSSKNEINISENVRGEINFEELKENDKTNSNNVIDYIKGILTSIASSALIILFIIFVLPKFNQNISEAKLLESFGLGIGFLVVVPIITILLFMTIIGVMPAFLLIAIYIAMLAIGYTISAISIAGKIYKRINQEGNSKLYIFLFTIITLIALNLISSIPVIGGIVSFVLTMIGDGIIISNIIKAR